MLLHLPSVLVELLIIQIGLYLINNLLSPGPRAILRLCQLLHRRRINNVGMTMSHALRQVMVHWATLETHSTLLGRHYGLCLSLGLGLCHLQIQTFNLVHQSSNIWIGTIR